MLVIYIGSLTRPRPSWVGRPAHPEFMSGPHGASLRQQLILGDFPMTPITIAQAITADRVRDIFKGLENGDGAAFFSHVADDVDWTVMGTHPLAGRYRSKADFIAGTFTKLGQVLPQGTQLHLEYLIVKGDQAVVELHSLATARNGMRFDNRYCWILFFEAAKIVRVRAYLDSALVAELFKENPVAA